MAVDVRAEIRSNLGKVISASLSDSYIAGTGIIKTTGSAVIDGEVLLGIGDPVIFNIFPPSGLPYRVPRYVNVVSIRKNPVERTTLVELACALAVREDWSDNIIWTPKDDPENDPAEVAEDEGSGIITQPIRAQSVGNFCLQRLGLLFGFGGFSRSNFPQRFSRPEFDFSPGYSQILSDLALSNNGVLYASGPRNIAFLSDSLPIPTIYESRLISLEPGGNGKLPSGVTAEYSTLRLKEPDAEDIAAKNWEVEEVIGPPATVRLSYKQGEELWEETFNYIPWQKTFREYDLWNRQTRTITVNRAIGAVNAGSYCLALVESVLNQTFEDGTSGGVVGSNLTAAYFLGKKVFDTVTTSEIKYKLRAPIVIGPGETSVPFEGYEEVLSETQRTYKAEIEILSSVSPGFFDEDGNLIDINIGITRTTGLELDTPPLIGAWPGMLTEETVTTYDQSKRNVTVVTEVVEDEEGEKTYKYGRLGYFPVTKTITRSRKCYALTAKGQQDIAKRVEQGETLEDLRFDALRLVDDGPEVRIVSGREAVLQARPSFVERILAANSKAGDNVADNGYSTEEFSESVTVSDGESPGLFPVGFRVPYVSDDTFKREGVAPNYTYTSEPADPDPAGQASAFGRRQARLLTGAAFGYSLQCEASSLGSQPAGQVIIKLGNTSARFRLDGITYTMSSEGIVASADLISLGNTGGVYSWLPKPSTIPLPDLPVSSNQLSGDLLGTVPSVGEDPQATLNAAFPDAQAQDGVRDEDTFFYWVYDGSTWINVGLTPGEVVENPITVPIFEEILKLGGSTRSKGLLTVFNYSLSLLTEPDPISVVSTADVRSITAYIEVPAITTAIQSYAPSIEIVSPFQSSIVNSLTYTGTGAALTVQTPYVDPSLIFIRDLNNDGDIYLFDKVRGATKYWRPSNGSGTEVTNAQTLTAFGNASFTLGTSSLVNTNGNTYLVWAFGGTAPAVTNTSGTIQTTVSASDVFSIARYTGNGVAGATIGHGLAGAPDAVLVKRISAGVNAYGVMGGPTLGANVNVEFGNPAEAKFVSSSYIRTTSATTVALGSNSSVNSNGGIYAAYCFRSVAGKSKIGTYTGDGSGTGQFIECNFPVDFVIVKAVDTFGGNWFIFNRTFEGTGKTWTALYPLAPYEELNVMYNIEGTGFRVFISDFSDLYDDLNASGETYFYMAFAAVRPNVYVDTTMNIGLQSQAPSISAN